MTKANATGDPAGAPAPAPEPAPTPAEPKLADNIREKIAATEESEAPAAAPVAAPTPTEEALASALPELTAEQIAALAERPEVVEAVLGSQTGSNILDSLFKQVMAENEQTAQTVAAQRREAATIEEAFKQGQEEGDWSAFGKLAADRFVANAESARTHKAAMGEVLTQLDSAVEKVYGDVLDTLTEADLAQLSRGNYRDDTAFMVAVLGTLDTRRQEMVRSQLAGSSDSSAEEAAAIAAAAGKAREKVGVGALPGGSGVESPGDTIGSLLRQALSTAMQDAEE